MAGPGGGGCLCRRVCFPGALSPGMECSAEDGMHCVAEAARQRTGETLLNRGWSFDVQAMAWQDLFFTSEGITVLTIASVVLLLLFRTFGPREIDESERMRREMWDSHYERFGHPTEKRWKRKKGRLAASQGDGGDDGVTEEPATPTNVRLTKLSVGTIPGPTIITTTGSGDASLVFVTYHDIGTTWRTAFGDLLDWPFMEEGRGEEEGPEGRSEGTTGRAPHKTYHIGVPGHQEGDDWCYGMKLNLEALAHSLHQVVERLKIPPFVGVATGAGANVMLRYATLHPEHVRGLVLASPSVGSASVDEAFFLLSTELALKASGMTAVTRSSLAGLLLLPSAGERERQLLSRTLCRMNATNVAAFASAFRTRDSLVSARLDLLRDVPLLLLRPPAQSALSLSAAARFILQSRQDCERIMQHTDHPASRVGDSGTSGRLLGGDRTLEHVREQLDSFLRSLSWD